MASKNLYWFKLKNTYFNQLVQKKMKRQKNGKDMQIIYLRMLLLSLDNQGYIHYQMGLQRFTVGWKKTTGRSKAYRWKTC